MPAKDVTVEGSFTVDGIEYVVDNRLVDVYSLQGVMLKRQKNRGRFGKRISTGIYIVNGKKMVVK